MRRVTETSPFEALQRRADARVLGLAARGVVLLIAVFIAWAAFTELDEVASAMGEVAPRTKLQVVQHLEGGIITSIHVKEGDHVRQGETLLQLDLATVGINQEEKQAELDGLVLARARLQAELDGGDPAFPEAAIARRGEIARSERDQLAARIAERDRAVLAATQRASQKRREVDGLKAMLASKRNDLELRRQQLDISTRLLQDGLTSRMDHLDLEGEVERLEGEVASLVQSVSQAQAAYAEALTERESVGRRFTRRAAEEMAQVERELARLSEGLSAASDQQARTLIRSPIAGVVTRLRHNTVGGVVRPGEPIMEIIPEEDELVVVARLRPVDRGYVRAGQDALIKVSTFDYARYGGLDGRVERIAADSQSDAQTGMAFFEVVVSSEKSYLGESPGELEIRPGMEATVDIRTGTRSVLEYLLKPVLRIGTEGFRER